MILTPRETQVLELMCQGKPSKTIARDLGISVRTVTAYRSSLKEKSRQMNAAGVVGWALRTGLVKL